VDDQRDPESDMTKPRNAGLRKNLTVYLSIEEKVTKP